MSEKKNEPYDVYDYINRVIKKSWTWARLTEKERERFLSMEHEFNSIKGRKEQRIEWLMTIYTAFLTALGYDNYNWREPNKEDITQF